MKTFPFTFVFALLTVVAFFSLSSFSLKYANEISNFNETINVIKSDRNYTGFKELASEMPEKPLKKAKRTSKKINKKNDEPKVEGLGLAGFILGLVGWFIPYLGLLMCLLAIIFGGVSLGRIARNPDKFKGRGFGITALIMGILGILVSLLIIVAIASIFLI
jgi:hypothetical protein